MLAFKRPVTLSAQPANATANNLTQTTPQLAQVYQRLGFVANSVDWDHASAEFSKLERAASYDAGREAIFIAPEAVQIGRALAGGEASDSHAVAAVIAFTHALQEQHFRWQQRAKEISTEDSRLAFRAVAGGDAITVALHFLSPKHAAPAWADQVQAIGRLTAELARAASSLPPMLREKLVFPYRDGVQFVQWAYAAKGWAGVNALFADPPVSSAQILHPEQYYLRQRAPVQIIPFGLFRQAKNNPVVEQTFGEFLIQTLLASNHSPKDAALIASGWAGDYLAAYPDGRNLIIAWLSAWTDDAAAQRFSRALQTVLERRHRFRFVTASGEQDGLKAQWGAGRTSLLQVRGAVVLLLDGASATGGLEASAAIWRDLEIRSAPATLPFETAKRPLQRSFRSR